MLMIASGHFAKATFCYYCAGLQKSWRRSRIVHDSSPSVDNNHSFHWQPPLNASRFSVVWGVIQTPVPDLGPINNQPAEMGQVRALFTFAANKLSERVLVLLPAITMMTSRCTIVGTRYHGDRHEHISIHSFHVKQASLRSHKKEVVTSSHQFLQRPFNARHNHLHYHHWPTCPSSSSLFPHHALIH